MVNPLSGDYNNNGIVDAADYIHWRNRLGFSITMLNETASPGVVDQADYVEWRANFGSTGGVGAGGVVAVPEAGYFALAAGLILLIGFRRGRFPVSIATDTSPQFGSVQLLQCTSVQPTLGHP
jgi:hypothetical protein